MLLKNNFIFEMSVSLLKKLNTSALRCIVKKVCFGNPVKTVDQPVFKTKQIGSNGCKMIQELTLRHFFFQSPAKEML